jgi:hypothetical protein
MNRAKARFTNSKATPTTPASKEKAGGRYKIKGNVSCQEPAGRQRYKFKDNVNDKGAGRTSALRIQPLTFVLTFLTRHFV